MTKSDRILTVGAAQLGPIGLNERRPQVVDRLLSLLDKAHDRDCDLVVYPELALTTFFPRWYFEDKEQIEQYFESAMPSNETQPLFDRAAEYGIGFCLGFAERSGGKYFNTCILVDKSGTIVGKYRKVHLPGHSDHKPERKWQHLEKAYFDVGDLGFPVWRTMGGIMGMCICNDRRWPESFRALALRGAELVMVGYNTPLANPDHPQMDHLVSFHHQLCLQAAAYQNGMWIVGVAKAGEEEGVRQLGGTSIVAPSGEVVALAQTIEDELVVHRCNLDDVLPYKNGIFNFAANRQIRHYQVITDQTAATAPAADGEETSS